MNRLLPQPLFSLFLLVLWLLLNNTVVPGQILLGTLLALALPPFTVRFWPTLPRVRHPFRLLRFLAVLLRDIISANLTVARLILGRPSRLRPALVRLPLDLDNDFVIVVLAHTISLTPGTVSAELSDDRRTLLIHALDVEDEMALIARIKHRYERPLKEIFAC
jgi:multicomponent K+:H+ antiporter subunit E